MTKPFTIEDVKRSAVAKLNEHLWTDKEPGKKKRSKYGSARVEFDGKIFDSKKELDRYITLRMLLVAGEIKELNCQVEFILETEDKKVCSYFADFVYTDRAGKLIVEDVKSAMTRRLAVYRLKKKLMATILKIEIKEV
jgi:hypothetical protein